MQPTGSSKSQQSVNQTASSSAVSSSSESDVSTSSSAAVLSTIRSLVSVSIQAQQQGHIESILPLLLLEDAFDALPIELCEQVWGIVEELTDSLALIANKTQRNSMALLRFSTGLMRRLSSVQSVLFGRLLLTLAYIFPLTDKSGVNLLGAFNTANATSFEGDEQEQILLAEAIKHTAATAASAAQQALAAVKQQAEEGSEVSWNPLLPPPHRLDGTLATALHPFQPPVHPALRQSLCEALADIQAATAAAGRKGPTALAAAFATSPAIYRTFWRTFSYCSAPAKAYASTEAWAFFSCSIALVLRLFQEVATASVPATGAAAASSARPTGVLTSPTAGAAGAGGAAGAAAIGKVAVKTGKEAAEEGEEGEEIVKPLAPAAAVAHTAASAGRGGAAGGRPAIVTGTAGAKAAAAAALAAGKATAASALAAPPAPIVYPAASVSSLVATAYGGALKAAAVPAHSSAGLRPQPLSNLLKKDCQFRPVETDAARKQAGATALGASNGRPGTAAGAGGSWNGSAALAVSSVKAPNRLAAAADVTASSSALKGLGGAASADAGALAGHGSSATSGRGSLAASSSSSSLSLSSPSSARAHQQAGSSSAAEGSAASAAAASSQGVKHLTNRRLFSLELNDTALRRHVMLQYLLLLQYTLQQRAEYEVYMAAGGTQVAAAAVSPAIRKPKESFSAAITAGQLQGDCSALMELIYAQLKRSGPDGPRLVQGVSLILQRDSMWRHWKYSGAPRFEKFPEQPAASPAAAGAAGSAEEGGEAGLGASGRLSGVKRAGGSLGGGGLARLKRLRPAGPQITRSLNWAGAGVTDGGSDLLAICADSRRLGKPSLSDYLLPMRVALDPSSGIEREYYPSSSDAVFVWRSYRLLAQQHISLLQGAGAGAGTASATGEGEVGDYVTMICGLLGVQVPETEEEKKRKAQAAQEAEEAAAAAAAAEAETEAVDPGVSERALEVEEEGEKQQALEQKQEGELPEEAMEAGAAATQNANAAAHAAQQDAIVEEPSMNEATFASAAAVEQHSEEEEEKEEKDGEDTVEEGSGTAEEGEEGSTSAK